MTTPTMITVESLPNLLADDIKVKVAGIDSDGVLRGKVMAKEKFLGIAEKGFGFSSALFGWDMHDMLWTTDARVAPRESGYADFLAVPDLNSFRRLPWEENIPFFLVRFLDDTRPVSADGRSMLRSLCDKLAGEGLHALAGVELEFMNFQTPSEDGYGSAGSQHPNLATFLEKNAPSALRPITAGMFCYSSTRPVANKKYFYDIFNTSAQINCGIEGWHTEGGPGVYEAALKVSEISEMADKVALFKLLTKSLGVDHGVTPCFMAKPMQGMPGSSGHIHISLADNDGKNLFARETPEANPQCWGLEDRIASIRLITPPVCKPGATRFEVRIPGADLHPHYALSVILAAGWRGVQKKIEIKVPPMSARTPGDRPELLPNTLDKALDRFSAPGSVAREILSSEFVDFFTATRQHELGLWREAVTDWELKRYIEIV
ncbi:Glutamine synthetase beta-Grasp [Penicillium mononematosum]|uniref:Glutamine synthetase beta-Grasp n=1 Tax=Penicillium mononematosum TaxID=268346 RepID=UPI002548AAE3|nr:Glutamine synthetase beta-Grasp [Penicillium mononematosum]KAJ6187965.1 Glutamine synthetase beta-Grasp [Penicillium mononematosum]